MTIRLFALTMLCAFAASAEASVNQRVEIQPGGWVRIEPQVVTDVYCVGSSNQITKLCRCDFDVDNKFRAELVMITNGSSEKVTALTPYVYPTYESCYNQLSNLPACK